VRSWLLTPEFASMSERNKVCVVRVSADRFAKTPQVIDGMESVVLLIRWGLLRASNNAAGLVMR